VFSVGPALVTVQVAAPGRFDRGRRGLYGVDVPAMSLVRVGYYRAGLSAGSDRVIVDHCVPYRGSSDPRSSAL
jgi:hypothetical protein